MKRLFYFQFVRLKNQKLMLLLPILTLFIGGTGILLGYMYYGGINTAPQMWLLSLYNSYTQFTFLFLIYIFVSFFTNDFTNGIYSYMKQIGFSLKKCIVAKMILLFLVTFGGTNLFFIFTSIVVGNKNYYYLLLMLLSVNLSLIFIILFTLLLSLILKKTMVATISGYLLFMVMNVINLFGFGLTNPADGNSISSITFRAISGREVTHYSLKTLNLDYSKYSLILTSGPTLVWIGIISVIIICLLKKERKINEV